MKYAWQIITGLLTAIWVGCFILIYEYDKELHEYDEAYVALVEEYTELENRYEELKQFYEGVVEEEFKEIDEYIAWKEGLTSLHQVSVPKIEISDKDRQEFWKNYFQSKDYTTTEE